MILSTVELKSRLLNVQGKFLSLDVIVTRGGPSGENVAKPYPVCPYNISVKVQLSSHRDFWTSKVSSRNWMPSLQELDRLEKMIRNLTQLLPCLWTIIVIIQPTAPRFADIDGVLKLYLSNNRRQDIQIAVAFLCTRVKYPDIDDYQKLTRVMQYIRDMTKLTLKMPDSNPNFWVDDNTQRSNIQSILETKAKHKDLYRV